MDPLIKITSIPISIEYKINNSRLERQNSTAELEISRDKGGLTIKSHPIKLNIDTFEARNSVTPTTNRSIGKFAQKGKSAAYEATARFAREGQMLLDVQVGQDAISNIAEKNYDNSMTQEFGLDFLPKYPPEISWTPPDLTIEYEMDKLNFDWKTNKGDFQFIPGNIEFTVTQHQKVIVEYIGGPIYVPPSADPDYTPIDVKV